MPTPVSALIHAATMVKNCHILMRIRKEKFRYMLKTPEINKFINTIVKILYEIYKTILFFNLFYILNRVNQQETILGSSETVRERTYDFKNYNLYKPIHKKIDKEFLIWFIGYFEGMGKFMINKEKVYIDLREKPNNKDIIYKIRTNLGFGQIKIIKDKEIVYYITGLDNFIRIINLFNGNIINEYKKEEFKIWLEVFNKQYKNDIKYIVSNIKPSFYNYWLCGFFDTNAYLLINFYIPGKIQIKIKHQNQLDLINVIFNKYKIRIDNNIIDISHKPLIKLFIKYFNQYPLKTIKRVEYFKWLRNYKKNHYIH
jgi:hypothetical protein